MSRVERGKGRARVKELDQAEAQSRCDDSALARLMYNVR